MKFEMSRVKKSKQSHLPSRVSWVGTSFLPPEATPVYAWASSQRRLLSVYV